MERIMFELFPVIFLAAIYILYLLTHRRSRFKEIEGRLALRRALKRAQQHRMFEV
jgi:hypothetical protein